MRAIVSLISAFAVFVHAAVGCCAHHVHAEFGPAACAGGHGSYAGTQLAEPVHDHAGADCGEHSTAAEQGGQREKHGPSQGDCDGVRCLGIRVAKTTAVETAGSAWEKLFSAPQVELTSQGPVLAAWLMGVSFAPPVRRHLAHCVLLI